MSRNAVRPTGRNRLLRYNDHGMQITSGRVVAGHVELDSELPEGTKVTVLITEGDETFEADPELERVLLQSIAQADEGRTVPFETVLAELRSRE